MVAPAVPDDVVGVPLVVGEVRGCGAAEGVVVGPLLGVAVGAVVGAAVGALFGGRVADLLAVTSTSETRL